MGIDEEGEIRYSLFAIRYSLFEYRISSLIFIRIQGANYGTIWGTTLPFAFHERIFVVTL